MSHEALTSSAPATPPRLTFGGMAIQTRAMLVDAYRELNSKKLFWITMFLSGIVVGAFGAVGFDETGVSIFWKHFRSPFLNTTFLPIQQLYKNLFISLGVQTWLSYFGLILALISTAPMIPDFLSGGAVDLFLARPMGRLRLFVTKYVVGMLFVGLQVTVFCVASFLVLGLRGGAWVPGLFLAIPVVLLIFSYLWGVCVLVGTLTRSTITAILITMVVWLMTFALHQVEGELLRRSIVARLEVASLDTDVNRIQAGIADFQAKLATTQPTESDLARLKSLNAMLNYTRASRAAGDPYSTWHRVVYWVYWFSPKTTESANLMERWLDRQFIPERDLDRDHRRGEQKNEDDPETQIFQANRETRRLAAIELDKEMRSRSVFWVIGTSLIFEATMLGLAAFVFVRRDY